jgi:hypothetical protein
MVAAHAKPGAWDLFCHRESRARRRETPKKGKRAAPPARREVGLRGERGAGAPGVRAGWGAAVRAGGCGGGHRYPFSTSSWGHWRAPVAGRGSRLRHPGSVRHLPDSRHSLPFKASEVIINTNEPPATPTQPSPAPPGRPAIHAPGHRDANERGMASYEGNNETPCPEFPLRPQAVQRSRLPVWETFLDTDCLPAL